MKEFQNGWPGVKEYALRAGIVEPEDGDDAAAQKVIAALRSGLDGPTIAEEVAAAREAEAA